MTGKIFYLVYYGYEKTVIDSQVITPVLKLKGEGVDIGLVFFEKFSHWLNKAQRINKKKRLGDCGLEAIFLPRVPRNLFYLNTILFLFIILPALWSQVNTVVHARGFQGARSVLLLKKMFGRLRLICDVRGIESQEYEYNVLNNKKRALNIFERLWKRILERGEAQVLLQADGIFCVSQAMMKYLKNRFHSKNDRKWHYVPCAVDVKSFSSKRETAFQNQKRNIGLDRFVIVYSGSSQTWQAIHLLPRIFKLIKIIEPRSFLKVLTPDADNFKDLMAESNIGESDYSVSWTEYEKMPEELVEGDMGLLIREPGPVNAFSCPTKFAEYLAAGLHVLTTPAVVDFDDIVRREPVGTLIEDIENERKLEEQLRQAVHRSLVKSERIFSSIKIAESRFDWKIYIPQIKKWYLELENDSFR